MPQLIIRSDHEVRLSAAEPADDGRWVVKAILLMTESQESFETASAPRASPEAAREEALVLVRQLAGLPPD